jgi:hypothetical protein
VKIDALIERDGGVGASALPLTPVQRSAWKVFLRSSASA